jgi:hypothetical protein
MDETVLLSQLNKLRKVALRAGLDEALAWLGPHLREMEKSERERSWPLGRCVWCWVDAKRLREATAYDQGGGPPMCDAHFDEHTAAAA